MKFLSLIAIAIFALTVLAAPAEAGIFRRRKCCDDSKQPVAKVFKAILPGCHGGVCHLNN